MLDRITIEDLQHNARHQSATALLGLALTGLLLGLMLAGKVRPGVPEYFTATLIVVVSTLAGLLSFGAWQARRTMRNAEDWGELADLTPFQRTLLNWPRKVRPQA